MESMYKMSKIWVFNGKTKNLCVLHENEWLTCTVTN